MGLLRMATRTAVVAGTATAVAGRVGRRQEMKYADQDAQAQQAQQQESAQAPPPPPPAAPAADDMGSQIQHLADLHQQGVLTDEEFASAKAKLISGG
jgi:hypothetical protein